MGRKVMLDDAEQYAPTQDLNVPTGSIREVEEAIAVDEHDLGTSNERPRVKDEVEDVEMVEVDAPEAGGDTGVDVPPKHGRTTSPSPATKKRQKPRNGRSSVAEENNSRTPGRPAHTRRTHSQVEVVVPPRPSRASPQEDNTPTPAKPRRSASHKLVASEQPVSVKKSSPVKVKTPARSAPVVEEEGEKPVTAKRVPSKRVQKRKRDESESEEEQEQSEKPTPGPSNPKPTQTMRATQRPPRGSSSPAPQDDPPSRGRRSAARKADEKLKDIMPDVINFQKQMKRGAVVSEWERAEKEQEKADKKIEKEKSKENAREKMKETAKRRRSDVR